MNIRVIGENIKPGESFDLGVIYGFFALNWTELGGYNGKPIIGYSSNDMGVFLIDGYDKCASFDENNRLIIRNPATSSVLYLSGIVVGVK